MHSHSTAAVSDSTTILIHSCTRAGRPVPRTKLAKLVRIRAPR
jgi:hypothetical protein